MMKETEMERKFKEIVADIFRTAPAKITLKTRFVEDLRAKSMDVIALIAATESAFGIKIPTQDANRNKTFGEALAYIKRKVKEKKGKA